MRDDAEVQQAVLAELRQDPRVEEADVGVEVAEGVVTLSGTVTSYPKRACAEVAARRVVGVVKVDNQLLVVLRDRTARTDAEIAQAVRDAFDWDVELPAEGIRYTVAGGVVTLSGEVAFDYQRDFAERAVSRLKGVRRVVNHLQAQTAAGGQARAASTRQ